MTVQVEQLITEHLDLWTQAQTTKSTSGRGSNNKIDLTGIKKLRELILELAVRGKLVPQDPNDEPASELLKRIAAEKEALVKTGKLKKQKPLPPITDEEKPYELPIGWEWSRLGQLGLGATGKTPSTSRPDLFIGDIPFIGPGQISADGVLNEAEKFLSEGAVSHSTEGLPNDILTVCIGGSIGKSTLLKSRVCFNQQINSLRPLITNPNFILYAVRSLSFMNALINQASGSATPIINRSKWEELLLPLPCHEAQQKIVEKVDELMALCDQLEQQSYHQLDAHNQLVDALLATLTQSQNADELASNWQRLAAYFDALFTTEYSIDALKQTILQLAVMGKLVKQDPNDEPASELLKRIAAEKDALVKAGKIKKQKPLPPISDDEKPFELPEGWVWCRLADIASFENGDRSSRYPNSSDLVSNGIPFFGAYDIKDAKLAYSDELRYITEEKFAELSNGKLSDGDFVMLLRGSVGKTAQFLSSEFFSTGFINAQMLIIRLVNRILERYIEIYFDSELFKNQIFVSKSGAVIQQIPASKISELMIPLPPTGTLSRITLINRELLQICDSLAEKINSFEKIQAVLAESLVEQVVA
ncbi:restriction endonuclease subunit S [Alishewanella tabrizica]|uniref:Type I restriction endonuclease EcoAI subunit S n=1 Tax=Alishewanella tabrizica TaxID=671278 RepID=A0ABQ2WJ34_9ALTE|nr:restriction endonuclease subunit S [Alishewanella tabrizica]GGW57732.1 type I restriction endonuclease EcoAI subunit S [Alishewanella tabrizica]